MVRWVKGFFQALSLLSLGLYCRAVLAVDTGDVVKAYIAGVTPPPVAADNIPRNTVPPQQEAVVQSLQGAGRLILMLGVLWLLVNLVRKLGGGKPSFNKPLITLGAGAILIFIGPDLVT